MAPDALRSRMSLIEGKADAIIATADIELFMAGFGVKGAGPKGERGAY